MQSLFQPAALLAAFPLPSFCAVAGEPVKHIAIYVEPYYQSGRRVLSRQAQAERHGRAVLLEVTLVMAGLVPAIHVFLCRAARKDVDARDKRGNDESAFVSIGMRRRRSAGCQAPQP